MKFFNNLKMIQKLVSAFLLVAVFLGLVGFIGTHNMKNINTNVKNIYNDDLIGVKDLISIRANLLDRKSVV